MCTSPLRVNFCRLPSTCELLVFTFSRHNVLRPRRDSYIPLVLYMSGIRAKLEYSSVFWDYFTSMYSDKVERVQRKFYTFF